MARKSNNEALKNEHFESGENLDRITKPAKQSPYQEYDKWKIESQAINPDGVKTAGYRFTYIKKRKDVPTKLEPNVVEMLNSQSHNSLTRYALVGSKMNGDEEIVTIK